MSILDSFRQAPSVELNHVYLIIGKMINDPRCILEVCRRLHIGMIVRYTDDDPLGLSSEGIATELRDTHAVVQDNLTRRRWAVLHVAILLDATSVSIQSEVPPPRPRPEKYSIGETVAFVHKHLNDRVGIIVRRTRKLRLSPCQTPMDTDASHTAY